MQRLGDLDAMQTFLALAEELSFRRAAVRLNLDQSAVSRRIQTLEQDLGFPLFARTTRSVSLTEAGRALAERGHLALAGFSEAIDVARRAAKGEVGRLRVSYMAFAALDVMPRAMKLYGARHPDVSVELDYRRTQAQKLALARGEIDAGFAIGPFDHPDFEALTVAREPLLAVVPASSPLAARQSIGVAELAEHPFVLGATREWDHFRMILDDLFNTRGLRLQVAHEPSNTLAIIGLVASGLGVTLYPASLARLSPVGVRLLPLTDSAAPIETTLLWRRTESTPPLRWFVAVCREVASEGLKVAAPAGQKLPASSRRTRI